MITPKWLTTKCQPIGIANVLDFLIFTLFKKETYRKSFDIGCDDVLTYKEILLGFAKIRGLKRTIITLPVMMPKLSFYWLYFITSTTYSLASSLVGSMKVEVVCDKESLEIEQVVNTNLLGVIRLTKVFIPHFRENEEGVFITISSIGGLVAYPFFSLYHATKWAIEGWTESMAFELNRLGIQIKTVQPGPTKTDFVGRSLVIPENPAYDDFFDGFKKVFFSNEVIDSLAPAETVSEIIYEAATDGKNRLRYLVGPVANGDYNKRLELGAEAFHQDLDKAFFG